MDRSVEGQKKYVEVFAYCAAGGSGYEGGLA
jgi:hypothetical protein